VLGFRRGHRRCGQVVDLWRATGAPRRRRSNDDARHGEGMSRAWSRTLIACREEQEVRLEPSCVGGASGVVVPARSGAEKNEPRGSGGVPGKREGDRREGGTRGSPTRENFTGKACRYRRVWRSILSIRRCLEQEEERGSREERLGYL
jgi:hypothetical protein